LQSQIAGKVGVVLHIIDNLFDTPINFSYSPDNLITNTNCASQGGTYGSPSTLQNLKGKDEE
jgi:hypothetical protein